MRDRLEHGADVCRQLTQNNNCLCAPFQFEVGDIRPDVGCFAELPHLQVSYIYIPSYLCNNE